MPLKGVHLNMKMKICGSTSDEKKAKEPVNISVLFYVSAAISEKIKNRLALYLVGVYNEHEKTKEDMEYGRTKKLLSQNKRAF